jgi:uncharacterized protein
MTGLALRPAARLVVVPGLHDSSPAHWQSWLQSLHRGSVRVVQRDWAAPDLERWAGRIGATIEHAGTGPFVVAAHSFGCLALARHLRLHPDAPVAAALFVAPADPARFGVADLLPQGALNIPTGLVASDTDPWMRSATARWWAQRWGCHWVNLVDAGHINAEAGFGPLPLAQRWVVAMGQRLERAQRSDRAELAEWSFAV